MFGEQFQLCRPVFLLFLMLTRGERIKFWLGPMNLFLLFAHLKKYIFIYFWLQHVEAWPGILGPQWGSELRHCSRKSTEPQPLDHQGTPTSSLFIFYKDRVIWLLFRDFACFKFFLFCFVLFAVLKKKKKSCSEHHIYHLVTLRKCFYNSTSRVLLKDPCR